MEQSSVTGLFAVLTETDRILQKTRCIKEKAENKCGQEQVNVFEKARKLKNFAKTWS